MIDFETVHKEAKLSLEALENIYAYNDLPKSSFLNWSVNNMLKGALMRANAVDEYCIFGFPCKEAVIDLIRIINGKAVYDIGAGVGYLSYALNKLSKGKLKITAIDNFETKFGFKINDTLESKKQWFPITKVDALTMIPDIKNSVIIINWPDYESDFAYNVAKECHPSNKLIYIGELGGCTANKKFFDNFELSPIPMQWYCWEGLHDAVYLVTKRYKK